ncbi:hypothetical protein TNCV_1083301 [Trichonephila clavipes]|nr:hypothetical protein TNCV_1083301 [Trichonephila clavipes]
MQINLEEGYNDFQELLDSPNQEQTINEQEQDTEEPESLDPGQSKDRMTVEEWSETNIFGNNSFQWCTLASSLANWADIENYVEFL